MCTEVILKIIDEHYYSKASTEYHLCTEAFEDYNYHLLT